MMTLVWGRQLLLKMEAVVETVLEFENLFNSYFLWLLRARFANEKSIWRDLCIAIQE